jgi:hypothetical protein
MRAPLAAHEAAAGHVARRPPWASHRRSSRGLRPAAGQVVHPGVRHGSGSRGVQPEGRENLAHGASRGNGPGFGEPRIGAKGPFWFRGSGFRVFSFAPAGAGSGFCPFPHGLRRGLLSGTPAGACCPRFSASSVQARKDLLDWRALRQFPHFCVARPFQPLGLQTAPDSSTMTP